MGRNSIKEERKSQFLKANVSTVYIQSSSSALFQFCTALFALLMMTAESMLSKRLVFKTTEALFFLFK